MLKPSPSSVSKMGNSLIRTRFSSSRLHSISGTTQGIDMVPNNFQIELKGLPIATSQFTGVKHVTHTETGWENSGSKETALEYDGFIVYVHFLNLGNLELESYMFYLLLVIYNYIYTQGSIYYDINYIQLYLCLEPNKSLDDHWMSSCTRGFLDAAPPPTAPNTPSGFFLKGPGANRCPQVQHSDGKWLICRLFTVPGNTM